MLMTREKWFSMRGTQMLILMKLISLSIDIETNRLVQFRFIDFIKYAISFDGIIFGPWISFEDFLRSMNQKKNYIVIFYNSKIFESDKTVP
jgi:hypothetical protein